MGNVRSRSLRAASGPPSGEAPAPIGSASQVPPRVARPRSETREEASAAGGCRGTFAEKARHPRRDPSDPGAAVAKQSTCRRRNSDTPTAAPLAIAAFARDGCLEAVLVFLQLALEGHVR